MFPLSPTAAGYDESLEGYVLEGTLGKKAMLFWNGSAADGKALIVQPLWSMEDLLRVASMRLGVSISRIYVRDGAVLYDPSSIDDNEVLFASQGEPFKPVNGQGSDHATIGGYTAGKTLGQGGFGIVRLGKNPFTGDTAALKFLSKHSLGSTQDAERILTEIRCLTELSHPNIVKLIDVVEDPRDVVLVLEYAPCGDLKSHLKTFPQGRLPEPAARTMFRQIVRAVAFAHTHDIAHRDLKLENILIGADGSPKITDFGLSLIMKPHETTRSTAGSLCYFAPELLGRTSNRGAPIDVWCLGIILFGMLVGHLPFQLTTRGKEDLFRRITKAELTFPDFVSTDAQDLIKCMLRVDPEARVSMHGVLYHRWLHEMVAPLFTPSEGGFTGLKSPTLTPKHGKTPPVRAVVDVVPPVAPGPLPVMLPSRRLAAPLVSERYLGLMEGLTGGRARVDTDRGCPSPESPRRSSLFAPTASSYARDIAKADDRMRRNARIRSRASKEAVPSSRDTSVDGSASPAVGVVPLYDFPRAVERSSSPSLRIPSKSSVNTARSRTRYNSEEGVSMGIATPSNTRPRSRLRLHPAVVAPSEEDGSPPQHPGAAIAPEPAQVATPRGPHNNNTAGGGEGGVRSPRAPLAPVPPTEPSPRGLPRASPRTSRHLSRLAVDQGGPGIRVPSSPGNHLKPLTHQPSFQGSTPRQDRPVNVSPILTPRKPDDTDFVVPPSGRAFTFAQVAPGGGEEEKREAPVPRLQAVPFSLDGGEGGIRPLGVTHREFDKWESRRAEGHRKPVHASRLHRTESEKDAFTPVVGVGESDGLFPFPANTHRSARPTSGHLRRFPRPASQSRLGEEEEHTNFLPAPVNPRAHPALTKTGSRKSLAKLHPM